MLFGFFLMVGFPLTAAIKTVSGHFPIYSRR